MADGAPSDKGLQPPIVQAPASCWKAQAEHAGSTNAEQRVKTDK